MRPVQEGDGVPNVLTALSDGALVRAWQLHDNAAFDTLYRRWRPDVHARIRRRVRCPATSDDLTQDTFTRLVRARDRIDPDPPLWPLLRTVADRLVIDHHRRRHLADGRARLVSLDDAAALSDPTTDPAAGVGAVDAAAITTALAALSARQAAALHAAYAGLATTTAASDADRQLLARARRNARAALRRQGHDLP